MATLTIDNSNGLSCASLREAAPTTTGLGGTAKEVGAYTTGDRRHWLFDFGAAPSLGGVATFSAAALSLTVADNMGVTTTDFDLYLLSSPTADTSQATWADRATGVPWGTAGALGAGDVNPTALATISDVVAPNRYAFTSAAFALAVQNWCNGVTAGLQVLMCRNPDTAYDLTSTEFWSTGAGAPTWPELTGTYTLGGGGSSDPVRASTRFNTSRHTFGTRR